MHFSALLAGNMCGLIGGLGILAWLRHTIKGLTPALCLGCALNCGLLLIAYGRETTSLLEGVSLPQDIFFISGIFIFIFLMASYLKPTLCQRWYQPIGAMIWWGLAFYALTTSSIAIIMGVVGLQEALLGLRKRRFGLAIVFLAAGGIIHAGSYWGWTEKIPELAFSVMGGERLSLYNLFLGMMIINPLWTSFFPKMVSVLDPLHRLQGWVLAAKIIGVYQPPFLSEAMGGLSLGLWAGALVALLRKQSLFRVMIWVHASLMTYGLSICLWDPSVWIYGVGMTALLMLTRAWDLDHHPEALICPLFPAFFLLYPFLKHAMETSEMMGLVVGFLNYSVACTAALLRGRPAIVCPSGHQNR